MQGGLGGDLGRVAGAGRAVVQASLAVDDEQVGAPAVLESVMEPVRRAERSQIQRRVLMDLQGAVAGSRGDDRRESPAAGGGRNARLLPGGGQAADRGLDPTCKKCTGRSGEGFRSAWRIPVPALMRCTSNAPPARPRRTP